MSAGIGALATYSSAERSKEQVIVTGDAAKAAKDGKLTIEIVRRDEGDGRMNWPMAFAVPGLFLGLAAMAWVSNRGS
jgi:hypothetical protein